MVPDTPTDEVAFTIVCASVFTVVSATPEEDIVFHSRWKAGASFLGKPNLLLFHGSNWGIVLLYREY